MIENVIRFIANVDGKISHWLVDNGTPIEMAEKMLMQFMQMIGQIKAQQEAQKSESEKPPEEDKKDGEQPS